MKIIKTMRLACWLGLLLLLIAACSQENVGTPSPTAIINMAEETADTAVTTPLPPTDTPTPTRTPVPTPAVPFIDAADQPLTDAGDLQIASVVSPEDGWLVLYAMTEGELGEVLGYTAVTTGLNQNLTLTIDPQLATPTLGAVLHSDAGESGEFEFPEGPDVPMQWESA
ncbi:MAG: hypothetical protein KC434_19095, partial [Anaerolineales bacterium]|nr:hypothetical protein [Anaerolineales bacterium]